MRMRNLPTVAICGALQIAGIALFVNQSSLLAADCGPSSPADSKKQALPADLHPHLLAVAQRVESDFAAKNPQAKGLTARVEALLKRKAPAPRTGFLRFVRLPTDSADVMPGVASRKG